MSHGVVRMCHRRVGAEDLYHRRSQAGFAVMCGGESPRARSSVRMGGLDGLHWRHDDVDDSAAACW